LHLAEHFAAHLLAPLPPHLAEAAGAHLAPHLGAHAAIAPMLVKAIADVTAIADRIERFFIEVS
jgi:hypothetical protein